MEDKHVDVLGTPYEVQFRNRKTDNRLEQCWGCCDNTIHQIIVNTLEEEDDGDIMNLSNLEILFVNSPCNQGKLLLKI